MGVSECRDRSVVVWWLFDLIMIRRLARESMYRDYATKNEPVARPAFKMPQPSLLIFFGLGEVW